MNSIIEAQFDFFHDRTISKLESNQLGSLLFSNDLNWGSLFDVPKQLPDKAPVGQNVCLRTSGYSNHLR